MLKINLPEDDGGFEEMMEKVDSFLRENEVPIHARPIKGWFEISKALKLNLILFSLAKNKADEGVYTGDDLTIRIFDWFDDRYGERLKIRWDIGRVVFMVREDLWEVRVPEIFGTVDFFISKDKKSSDQQEDLKLNRVPKCNIFDDFVNIPSALVKSLGDQELKDIAETFVVVYESMSALSIIKDMYLVKELLCDIESSVNHLLEIPPHYGMSKWASLQVLEKAFKAYLSFKGVAFPKSHKLNDLSKIAASNGLFAIEKALLAQVQCAAGARYGDEVVSKQDAHNAHMLSVILSGLVAREIIALKSNQYMASE